MKRRMKTNVKRMLVLTLALALAAAPAAGCAKKSSNEAEQIKASGVFRVAIVNTGSRYMYMAGDTPMGVEPDLAKYIGDAMGAEVQYQVCKKAEALAAVTAGEADVAVGCINRSGSLSTEYLMSDSYGKGYFYAVTKAGDYALTIGALKNSAVGVDQGLDEDTRSKLYQAEEIRLTDYGSAKEGGDDVKEGVIRAYICYEDQARILLEDEALQVQNITNLDPEEFVIVAGRSDTTLINGINTLIQQFLERE